MKRYFFLTIIIIVSPLNGHAQNYIYEEKHNKWDFVSESTVSFGLGMGDNSAGGAEMQLMFLPRWSGQLGVGINGFSGGINYHFFPTVKSAYISLQAWQKGFGTNYKAAYAGPMFVYRANKLFQAGLGVGYQINKNPKVEIYSKYVLMFNLGIYLPL